MIPWFYVELSDYVSGDATTIQTTEYDDSSRTIIVKIDLQENITRESGNITSYDLTTTKYQEGVPQTPAWFFVELSDYVGDDATTIKTSEYEEASRTTIEKIDLQENITRVSGNITSYDLTSEEYEAGVLDETSWFVGLVPG